MIELNDQTQLNMFGENDREKLEGLMDNKGEIAYEILMESGASLHNDTEFKIEATPV